MTVCAMETLRSESTVLCSKYHHIFETSIVAILKHWSFAGINFRISIVRAFHRHTCFFKSIVFFNLRLDYAYSKVPNSRGGLNKRGGPKFLQNKINGGGVWINGGRGKLGNPYLKMRYNFVLFMPIHRLISLIFYENIPLAHRNWLKYL